MLKTNNTKTARETHLKALTAFIAVLALTSITVISILSQAGIVVAVTNTVNTISTTLHVAGVCVPDISNALINFQSTPAGSFAPTANAEFVSETGTVASNIYLYSVYGTGTTGNWASGSNYFGVSNTLWNPTSDGSSNLPANALTNTISTDTQIYVSPGVATNDIYFGVNIPANTPTGTYTQGITISLSC